MPLKKGGKKVASENIAEMHKGEQYAKVKAKHGKKVANKMAVAAGLSAARGKPKVTTSDYRKK